MLQGQVAVRHVSRDRIRSTLERISKATTPSVSPKHNIIRTHRDIGELRRQSEQPRRQRVPTGQAVSVLDCCHHASISYKTKDACGRRIAAGAAPRRHLSASRVSREVIVDSAVQHVRRSDTLAATVITWAGRVDCDPAIQIDNRIHRFVNLDVGKRHAYSAMEAVGVLAMARCLSSASWPYVHVVKDHQLARLITAEAGRVRACILWLSAHSS